MSVQMGCWMFCSRWEELRDGAQTRLLEQPKIAFSLFSEPAGDGWSLLQLPGNI